jgi:hypothetical protein
MEFNCAMGPLKNHLARPVGVEFGLGAPAKMLIYCVETRQLLLQCSTSCIHAVVSFFAGGAQPNSPSQSFAAYISQRFPRFCHSR